MALKAAVTVSSAASLTLNMSTSVYEYIGTDPAAWALPPAGAAEGFLFIIANSGDAAITLAADGAELIDNAGTAAGTHVVGKGLSAQLISDGTGWLVLSGGGGNAPLFDNSARSGEVSKASGVAFTWTQLVAGNPYGVVAVLCNGGGSAPAPGVATAVVTFGGVTLTSLGWKIGSGGRFVWYFGGPNIPAGTQTVSVTITQGGKTFTGVGVSFTYNNAGYAGPLMPGFDSAANEYLQLESLPRSTVQPGVVISAAVGTWPNLEALPGLLRVKYDPASDYLASELGVSGPGPATLPWQIAGSYPVASSGTLAAIELLAAEPTTPHLKDKPYVNGSVTSFSYIATAGTYLLVYVNTGSFGSLPGGATYDGAAMTLIGTIAKLALYGMANVSGGTKTIAFTGGNSLAVVAASYAAVTAISAPQTAADVLTQDVTCLPNQLIVQGFGTVNNAGMPPPPGGTGFIGAVGDVYSGSVGVSQCPGPATFRSGNGQAGPAIAVVLS